MDKRPSPIQRNPKLLEACKSLHRAVNRAPWYRGLILHENKDIIYLVTWPMPRKIRAFDEWEGFDVIIAQTGFKLLADNWAQINSDLIMSFNTYKLPGHNIWREEKPMGRMRKVATVMESGTMVIWNEKPFPRRKELVRRNSNRPTI